MAAKKRRIFLGIPVPEDVSRRLAKQLEGLPGRSIPLENWHLTLHFLGDVEEERLLPLHKALQSLNWGQPYVLTFDRLGAFPNPKKAHTLWIGSSQEDCSPTNHLVQVTGGALALLDFPTEHRPYIVHMTVRRFSQSQNIGRIVESQLLQPISMTVDRVILYESILNEGPPHYLEIYTYRLGFGG